MTATAARAAAATTAGAATKGLFLFFCSGARDEGNTREGWGGGLGDRFDGWTGVCV